MGRKSKIRLRKKFVLKITNAFLIKLIDRTDFPIEKYTGELDDKWSDQDLDKILDYIVGRLIEHIQSQKNDTRRIPNTNKKTTPKPTYSIGDSVKIELYSYGFGSVIIQETIYGIRYVCGEWEYFFLLGMNSLTGQIWLGESEIENVQSEELTLKPASSYPGQEDNSEKDSNKSEIMAQNKDCDEIPYKDWDEIPF